MTSRPGFVGVFGAVFLLAIFMAVIFAYGEFSTCVPAKGPLTIEVKRGESLNTVVHRLAREGVLSKPRFLRILGILRGDTARIKAGEYVLQGNESPNQLLTFLVSGKAKFISLTVPEGLALKEIAQRVEEKELGTAEAFMALAHDPEFVASFGLPMRSDLPTLEGYIYPETYYFHRGVGAHVVLTQMVEQFRRSAYAFVRDNASRVGLTPYQVLILASIIEKETGLHSERRMISAVFHNRLKAGMHLGSDPTVIYGIDTFDGNLTRVHLRTVTRYNTYKILGLPPTPIANPGLESLKAAVNPEDVDYLYFVAKGDGSHFFSSDLKTHNRAVWKYQKRRYAKSRS